MNLADPYSDNPQALTQRFYLHRSDAYPCAYRTGFKAQSQIIIPPEEVTPANYSELVRNGFRRSGLMVYRPDCAQCQACTPLRIPVAKFAARLDQGKQARSQLRCLRRNHDLSAHEVDLAFDPAHYALYQRYQENRHMGGGMEHDSPDDYAQSMLCSQVDTRLIAFSQEARLLMLSVIDVLDDGLSAVYTFFDPAESARSLGTYNILWQIKQCLALGLPYLYLGYWIKDCRKMCYKANFNPFELRINGKWQTP